MSDPASDAIVLRSTQPHYPNQQVVRIDRRPDPCRSRQPMSRYEIDASAGVKGVGTGAKCVNLSTAAAAFTPAIAQEKSGLDPVEYQQSWVKQLAGGEGKLV